MPSSDFLQDYDKPVLEGNQEQFALKRFVDSVVSRYDVIWIDTPPNASNLPAWATLVASDFLMSPVIPEIHHVESIPDVTERVSQVTESANPTLVNLGLFITGIDNRTAIHRLHHQLVRQRYGAQVFDTVIPLRTDLKESAASEPIVFYKPRSEAAELVRKLLDEAVSRMHQATTALAACEENEPEKRAGNE